MPFLGALAAAKELNFSKNERHASQIAAYKVAYASMVDWINRMDAEMRKTPDLAAKLSKVGLRDEIRAALMSARANLKELDAIMEEFRTNAPNGEQGDLDSFLADARRNNPAEQVEALLTRFQPRPHQRIRDLATPQIPVRAPNRPANQASPEIETL